MFSGSLVAIVTPMRADSTVDFDAWTRLIDLHIHNGTAGVVIAGTTGESVTLSDEEITELVQRACAQADGRIQIIAGAGTSNTAATVDRTRRLGELPIDGILVVTPAYNRPTQEGLYQHYAAVARASRVPIILYNVPTRTAVDMLPATVARLAQLDRIVAIKEAVADTGRIRQLIEVCPSSFDVLSGDDPTACEAMLAGARGAISVVANAVPRAYAQMVEAALQGNAAQARELDKRLARLHRDLFVETNPIPVKWAMTRLGLIERGIRLPLTELSAGHHELVVGALREAGALG